MTMIRRSARDEGSPCRGAPRTDLLGALDRRTFASNQETRARVNQIVAGD